MESEDKPSSFGVELRPCRDCGVKPGELHIGGCCVEFCARCGAQALGCNCVYEVHGIGLEYLEEIEEKYPDGPTDEMYERLDKEFPRIPWSGEHPGSDACREFGFYCTGTGTELVSVPPGTPGAQLDWGRLHRECSWNANERRWVWRWAGR